VIRILDRYVLRLFFFNYGLSLFVMISLYITLDLFVNIDEFTENSPGLADLIGRVGSFYGYNLFLYFAQISGVITLFAGAITLARLQRANEMTALLASGTSMYRIAAPVVVAGLLMNGLWILDQEVLVPRVAHKLARPRDDVEGRHVYGVWCVRDREGNLLSTASYYPADRRMFRMVVLERDASGGLHSVITADMAEWDPQAGHWILHRGHRTYNLGVATPAIGDEEPMGRERLAVYRSDLTPEEIMLRQAAGWIDFLSLRQLAELQRRGVVPAERVAQVRHTRFTQPINNMILLLLGIVFFLHREPASVIVQGGKALATCAACFVIAFLGQNLIGSLTEGVALPLVGAVMIPAALPAWLPIFLFAPLCALLLHGIRT